MYHQIPTQELVLIFRGVVCTGPCTAPVIVNARVVPEKSGAFDVGGSSIAWVVQPLYVNNASFSLRRGEHAGGRI